MLTRYRLDKMYMYGKVILPTDGSELSFKGVKEGLKFAKKMDIPAVAVYVIKPSSYSYSFSGHEMGGLEVTDKEFLREGFRKQGKKVLKKVKEEADKMGVSLEGNVIEGIPYDEITKLADKGDIIYMSSHGRSGLSSVLLGSTTDRVIKNSRATVAVVKANNNG